MKVLIGLRETVRSKNSNTGLTSGFPTIRALDPLWWIRIPPISGWQIHYKNELSTLFTSHRPHLFLVITEIEECLERNQYLLIFLTSCNTWLNYREALRKIMFPALTPSSHKVNNFTERVFWQQLTVIRYANKLGFREFIQ